MSFSKMIGLELTPDTVLTRSMINTMKDNQSLLTTIKQNDQESAKRQATSARNLENLIKGNYIFADISALLAPAAERFFELALPLLQQNHKKIYIPYSVAAQMNTWAQDATDSERAQLCRKRLIGLIELQKRGLVEFRRNGKDDNPSRDLITYCAHFRLQNPLLVLTQEEKLARDLLSLNHQKSANGKFVSVKRINKYGYLSNLDGLVKKQPFQFCKTVRDEADTVLPCTVHPGENDSVFVNSDQSGEIRLLSELGKGGEGVIYRTNTPYIAKIYKEECCTAHRLEKLQKMIDAKLSYKGICFPISLLYNGRGEFIGYLMNEAKGYSIQSSIFRKPLFLRKLPGWKKADLVQCAITILYKIKYLHDNHILIGDINPNNFLVESPTEVYIVDTDSFQINDLPCPVGFPLYTAPELHARNRAGEFKDYKDVLRTKENEYFAVATLMFQLMLPGKPPYTQQGGENPVDNILEMHFPYAVGERKGENVPDGTWRFIWSHLTRRMKENFYKVFDKKEGNSEYNIKERLSVDNWIIEMREYSRILEQWKQEIQEFEKHNIAAEQVWKLSDNELNSIGLTRDKLKLFPDPQSLELYPNRLKRQGGVRYVTCLGEGCDREYPEDDYRLKAGYCPECQRRGETLTCLYCDTTFVFTNYEKYFKKFKNPLLCPTCRKKKDEVVITRECATPGCFNEIKVTIGNIAYWKSKGYDIEQAIPKYCEFCKKGKKIPPHNPPKPRPRPTPRPKPTPTPQPTPTPTPSGHSSGRKGCFITTAVCGFLGKPDHCAELMDFRWFRDNWLRQQPGGAELIEQYYESAPALVKQMEASPRYSEICQTLWEDYLVPCHQMIQKKQYEECRTHYTRMVKDLSELLQTQAGV